MKKISVFWLLVTILFSSTWDLSAQSQEFKAGKSLEIQSLVLRGLSTYYVDSVDVEKLVNRGITSMLETLDPYTEFIPEERESNIDEMTTGSYGGVGAVIKKISTGEIIISEPYENTPSNKMGLKPGDVILAVDGVSTQGLEVSQVSERMKGEPQTSVTLTIRDARTSQEYDVTLMRERIHFSDVVYYGMVQDSIGYIQISGFTLYGSKDVQDAYFRLAEGGKMKKLVLDLRGNGGGLMSEAVKIVSLFVPKGTLVVSQKGKDSRMNSESYTETEPIDTSIPIMVLVNSSSASSSEIVAGALQDLDRAVIAGVRTYGKGLVQNIIPVGYDSSLKLTIAKYYTPSGRCVQALDYSHRNVDGSVGYVPDSLKREFKTKNGRSVYDGGGVAPDIEVTQEYYTRPMAALIYSDILNDYALHYFKHHKSIEKPSVFSLDDKEYDDFVKFARERDFDFKSESQIEMERVIRALKREGLYEINKEKYDAMLDMVTLSKDEFLYHNKKFIKEALEQEICVKYYHQRGGAEYILRVDKQLHKALDRWPKTILAQ